LFRIVQEAMRNAVRHANATRITVRARRGEGHLRVEIEDDGKGVSSTELRKPESIGVLGMQERTRALGGQFVLNSEPGTGTKVTVRLPLVSRAKSEVMRSL
jgi:signal transduction histidine kinase